MSAETTSITFSMPATEIASLVQHKGDIWVGTTKGQIIQTQKDQALNHIQCWPDANTGEPALPIEPGSVVDGIYSIPSVDILVAHIKSSNGTGRAVIVRKEPPYLTDISKNCSFVAAETTDSCEFALAIAEGSKISMFRNNKGKLAAQPNVIDADSEVQALAINKQGIAYYAQNKYMIMLFKYFGKPLIVTSSFVQRPLVVPFDDLSFLFCLPGTIIIKSETQASSPFMYNKGLQNIPSVRPNIILTYQEKLFQFFPNIMASARISIKHQDPFQAKPISNVRLVAKYDKALFLVTDTEVRQFGGQTKGTECALKAESDGLMAAIEMFRSLEKDTQPNELIDMFKTLWKDGEIKLALNLLSEVMWPHDIREVISLFSPIMIELSTKLEQRLLLKGAKTITEEQLKDKTIKSAFGDFLEATQRMYKDSADPFLTSQLGVVDSSLFQFYALNHLTRRLDKLLSTPNSMDNQLIVKFLNEKVKKLKLHPAFAIYQVRLGPRENNIGVITALKVWEKLNDADKTTTRWAEEASYTLREIKTDTEGQSKRSNEMLKMNTLKWVLERSPMQAANTFLYPSVTSQEGNFVERWIDSVPANGKDTSLREGLRLVYLNYVTSKEANKPTRSVIDKALSSFCQLQMILENSSSVSSNLIMFGQIPEKEKPHDKIRLALVLTETKIIELVNMVVFRDELEDSDPAKAEAFERSDILKYINILEGKEPINEQTYSTTKNVKILYRLYQAGLQYKSAANCLVDNNGGFDKMEVQNFCRNAPTPEKAFWIFLQKIINPTIYTKHPQKVDNRMHQLKGPLLELISENIEWIDVAQMVHFDPETDLDEDETEEIANMMMDVIPDDGDMDSYFPLLRMIESILMMKERLRRAKLGVVRNLELDASYRLVLAQKRNVEVQHNTLCKTCQRPVGNGWLSISPDNEVYHIACVKNDDKNVPDQFYL